MSGSVSISLRPLEVDDVPVVATIEALSSAEPWSVQLFEGEFGVSGAARSWLVAEEDGAIVGFAGMMFVGDEGHLMNVAVHPDHRRRGIARSLCSALFAEAAQRGMTALTLEVRPSNRDAIELYRRFGFAPVGARPRYYRNPDGSREDALIMWLHDLSIEGLEARS